MAILLTLILYLILSAVFLIPLKDDRGPGKRFPMMTLTLIVINVVVFLAFHYFIPSGDILQLVFALFPASVLEGGGLGAASMITSAFLHAGWSHLLGNMFFLFFFGRKVEDLLGSWNFALFYLVCIFLSGIGSVVGENVMPLTQGVIPYLGASGAIMGVVAAYFFLYSEQRIYTLVVFLIIPIPVKIPVWFFALYTVLSDVAGAWLEQQFQAQGYIFAMIGFCAHLGGFVAGLTCLYLFMPAEVLYYRHRPSRKRLRD